MNIEKNNQFFDAMFVKFVEKEQDKDEMTSSKYPRIISKIILLQMPSS